jgi:hypothetical protein
MSFWMGSPATSEQRSLYGPEQQGIYRSSVSAAQGKGAGGAFGDAADYYRGLLSDNSADMDAFAAPELRRFREQTIPGLANDFAGMGAGALSSSGFRNAAAGAGTDLAERLASMRAGLRGQAAQGLMGIGQQALNPAYENIERERTPGFLESAGPGIAGAITAAGLSFIPGVGPFIGPAAGSAVSSLLSQNKPATSIYQKPASSFVPGKGIPFSQSAFAGKMR